jgi:hypothetical protein
MNTTNTALLTVAELNKAIDAWGKRGTTWTKEGHKLALSALLHLSKHGDIGPINRLYVAMPKGSKSSSMAQWIMSYAAVVLNDDAADKAKPFVYSKDKKCNLEAATKTPWYEFRPEPTPLQMFDLLPAIQGLLARAKKAADDGAEILHPELITQLQELVEVESEVEMASASGGDDIEHDEASAQ